MLNTIINVSIKNKFIVMLLVAGLAGWGIYSLTRLPIDAVPDITNNQIQVITTAPSLGATDVERFITVPVELGTRNVPGIIEQRSFSRFGLSVVTIVFNDKIDVYWARQQVSERLQHIRDEIPQGLGTPEMGPVTTGLGEIFQYVVRAKPGYEEKYDLIALRDIQDWIVRRQLLGTDGVADVSSIGGKVKQYEVAVNPVKLTGFQLTVTDIFNALEKNNQNTGGAYIEKGPSVLFIRSEGLVKNMEDIGNIVVKRTGNGTPVLMRDVAEIKTGTAIRYGATVLGDEGEVAGAIVMMLKGENSNKVIANVKARIKEIEKTLPEGVMIEPFLDRTKMVNNAIGTVENNLLEGALIVILVLVLFLGNLRAGFIVASVIPLAMLFAFSMMNVFGVSGNLMSLGALDFGLLVDGAVIIVEAVMHKLSFGRSYQHLNRITQPQMDEEVKKSSGKMMNSAVFGQIIILIVYLPILSLQGIEGKMFKPMAETVSFAIIGALILSVTYVPVMTSLVLSKKLQKKENFSDKMMRWIQKMYEPVLRMALSIPKTIVLISFIVFGIAAFILSKMGGEFIPQLEEGDFAIEARMLTGTSLTTTVENSEKIATVLKKNFPEVIEVVAKIGSGEIPTDPMPMEAADIMVILKPKKEWVSAKTSAEFAEKMNVALQEIPGVALGFMYPVQMRFNELMTGAKQDVVCKIFGDDLDTLAFYANKLTNIAQSVDGAKDIYTETVTGVPQMVITYNRENIAKFGADITDINKTIETSYAGSEAGLVFEGDKRYSLVVRMNEELKNHINDIGNLMIGLPNGQQVPLHQLASIETKDGPYQIQREDAQRRITVAFNVRGRDVQSIVTELQSKVKSQVKFPAGYYVTYGGQYENLQNATKRLNIALPIALVLIFIMLFFAFGKFKYCLLIFSAIPLSAVGGVLALFIRGMPFSISAGVGFIALFGVAVLNGIVLISEMSRLKKEGALTDIKQIIMKATAVRLRPVLMTAAVASLGFLPMALSQGAGAEVQRPLATVVIGGLITATLLTLLVLPALYLLFESVSRKKGTTIVTAIALLVILMPLSVPAQQAKHITLNEALQMASQQNREINISRLQEQYHEALKNATDVLPKTVVSAELGNVNSMYFDNKFMLGQSFSMPVLYKRQRNILEQQWQGAQLQTNVKKAEIEKMVKLVYLQLQYLSARQALLNKTDSIFTNYQQLALLRFKKGESNLLEKTTLDNQLQQVRMQLQILEADKLAASTQLALLIKDPGMLYIVDSLSNRSTLYDSALLASHPYLQYYRQQEQIAQTTTLAEKARLLPEVDLAYINQSISGWQTEKDGVTDKYFNGGHRFSAVQVGVGIPIFNKAQKAKIKAAKQNEAIAAANTELAEANLRQQLLQSLNEYNKYQGTINYYTNSVLPQAGIIIQTANVNYRNGEINYIEWGTLIGNALQLQSGYIDALKELNNSKIELEYLLSGSNQ